MYACWLLISVFFFASFHSKVPKVWKQKTNSERSKGTLVTTSYQFLNYVYCLYCLNSKCEFFRGKLPSIFEPWRLSGMLTNTMAGQNTDSCLRSRQQQSRYFWKPLLKKKSALVHTKPVKWIRFLKPQSLLKCSLRWFKAPFTQIQMSGFVWTLPYFLKVKRAIFVWPSKWNARK